MEGQSGRGRQRGIFVQADSEDIFDGAKGGEVVSEGALCGGLEAIMAHGFGEVKKAQGRPVGLFWMGAGGQDRFNQLDGARAHLGGPAPEALGRPIGVESVRWGHVGGVGGVAAGDKGAGVGGDTLAFEEDFEGGWSEADLDDFMDEPAGDAVIMPGDFDVIVFSCIIKR